VPDDSFHRPDSPYRPEILSPSVSVREEARAETAAIPSSERLPRSAEARAASEPTLPVKLEVAEAAVTPLEADPGTEPRDKDSAAGTSAA